MTRRIATCLIVTAGLTCALLISTNMSAQNRDWKPFIEPRSDEAADAIGGFKVPKGFKVELFAAEPDLANPVAISIDKHGRVFVCETFRQGDAGGVVDNRFHMKWLDDDLAAQTVADRRAMILKHAPDKVTQWSTADDRIRLLTDTDGDGKADKSTVFAQSFNDLVEGTGAGVLAWDGDVYYTCIPRLWLLKDTDRDGKADPDKRRPLHQGFGVRVAFRGHDLHGLVLGMDGKIYFSLGDRGYNVLNAEGKRLKNPDTGAVFRCNRDGSELEVIYTGLRNPQELAFDDHGNLFTVDNTSDAGDQARFTYLIEGGDSGWLMNYQYLRDRGPWNREGIWHLHTKASPAYVVPPIAHISSGPSGLAYYNGLGFPAKYKDHFFLCDFRGGAANSGILAFKATPKGAGFAAGKVEQFMWNILATDVEFGYDGSLYVADWVDGWEGIGKGRLYRVVHESASKDKQIARVQRLLEKGGFADMRDYEIIELLSHPERRLRLRVQFALVEKGRRGVPTLERVLDRARSPIARLHALWGLAQLGKALPQTYVTIMRQLSDDDPAIRVAAARALGDARYDRATRALSALLRDEDLHVRAAAAIALGKSGQTSAIPALLAMLRDNADADPWLRHAGVYGLTLIGDADALAEHMADEDRSARMGVLLTMRRLGDARIASFLKDSDPGIVLEAARAINDLTMVPALPALADLLSNVTPENDPLVRRALNAAFRVGGADRAAAVAAFAARKDVPEKLRLEAMDILDQWTSPSARDRVTNLWRPFDASNREPEQVVAAVTHSFKPLIEANTPQAIRTRVIGMIGRFRVEGFGPKLKALALDAKTPVEVRLVALKALHQTGDESLPQVVALSLADSDEKVRSAALVLMARLDPTRAIGALKSVLAEGTLGEKQDAFATIASLKRPDADKVITDWLDVLLGGKVDPALQHDLLEAARSRASVKDIAERLAKYQAGLDPQDELAAYRDLLHGGSVMRGREVFWNKVEAQCQRCHKVAGQGAGVAGPDLAGIGKTAKRDELMESLILPSRKITKGYQSLIIDLENGDLINGILIKKEGRILHVGTIDGVVKVDERDIDRQRQGLSPMPGNIHKLLKRGELRDLIEYLASLKTPLPGSGQPAKDD